MIDRLNHRGPDGIGFHLDGPVGLAHARLSIIDLNTGGQPIHNETKTVWVVFNGEIFNYIELRETLVKQGHRFYTQSDTEVIVHLYEEHGDDFVSHLNGQFAIALWDAPRRRLIVTRDRTGILPLFYTESKGRFLFASEVKALLPALPGSPTLNPQALDELMTFWAPVAPHTVFKDVHTLAPGTSLTVDESGVRETRYWDWRYPQDGDYDTRREADLSEELHALLVDATRIRLRSDVPVGAYLSGGLDSSILVSLIHHHGNAALRSFSLSFEDASHDESQHQRALVDHLKTTHSDLRCKKTDIAKHFIDTVWLTESPVLRTAPVPMGLLSESVRAANYKVVLTGEGADEVFGGYDIFKEAKIRRFWARYPDSARRASLLKRLYPYLELSQQQNLTYLKSFFGLGLETPDAWHFSHLPRWTTTAKTKEFLAPAFREQITANGMNTLQQTLPRDYSSWHPFHRSQYLEAKTLLPGYLLSSQGDRMLMGHSVEGRFPYLDHRVIEFANRLPPKLKMKVLNEKYLLRRTFSRYLPPALAQRTKQPYRAPDIASFTVGGELTAEASDLLSGDAIVRAGVFDAPKVERLLQKVRAGRAQGAKDNMAFVAMLSTQAWHRLFVEQHAARFRDPAPISSTTFSRTTHVR
jgi:asparagine synthase (glutamine-hydrolysing)